eukprot:CAMPEP_0185281916 /NCGR_PEP_ID=MMETSP1359-20130426/66982_1 /TAXON_ID=552665 /ORGANISM="Bigelowiella longifila, Strain CCMP242" /LENGTH=278 /DNA_ID=CAMNT_0027877399 /DNA_START=204 /DNA_END=1040 /DNA_ORIENTATION=-
MRVSVEEEDNTCSICSHNFSTTTGSVQEESKQRPSSVQEEQPYTTLGSNNNLLFRFLPIQGLGELPNGEIMQQQQLQRVLDRSLHESMQKPTSRTFLDNLEEKTLTKADFVPVVLRLKGLQGDIRCCRAKFGQDLFNHTATQINKEAAEDSSSNEKEKALGSQKKRVICDAPIIIGDPLHGESELENVDHSKDAICVFRRGKVSFVQKARNAEKAGCVAVIVVQNEGQPWPYHMTDSTNSMPEVYRKPEMQRKLDVLLSLWCRMKGNLGRNEFIKIYE